jgi:PAT family beta-lactamase induction signal transducer AmpG
MAATMSIGVFTTLLIAEPHAKHQSDSHYPVKDYLRFFLTFLLAIKSFVFVLLFLPRILPSHSDALMAFLTNACVFCSAVCVALVVSVSAKKYGLVNSRLVHEAYLAPVQDFFKRYGRLAIWVLLLVGFYRISDIVMGVIANVFYQDMSYTKIEIASVSKAFGVLMTIAGSFLGALIALRIGIMRALQFAAILVVLTNLLFCWLSMVGTAHTDFSFSLPLFGNFRFPLELTLVIGVDNLVQGLSLAAFIAWLSSLTNVSFTATQYAIFSSLMTMLPKVIGGYAGTLVDAYGYMHFFLFAALLGVPVIVLIHFLSTKLSFEAEPATR